MVDALFSFKPAASDPDGDVLSFAIENLPAWATFDAATGQLKGTPKSGDVGTYSGIRISATDGEATVSMPAFSVEVVATATGSASLSWTAPTQRTDGSPLGDLAGYRVYWGTKSGDYSQVATIDNPGVTTYVIDELTPGTWFFAAKAYDSKGVESNFSNEASKQIL